ncbi:MAG: hypothetical protein GTN83_22220 [Acidobacteria bacterium]|nr:hypothetical protein [Acidobacteriota bacterium]
MAKKRSEPSFKLLPLIGISVAVLLAAPVFATEKYNGPSPDYCVTCHPSFQSRGDLHDLHVGNGQFTGNCQLCHINQGDVPFLMYSEGDNSDGSGCMGCHGHDYGETILQDYGVGLMGRAKLSGYGLRRHHFNKNVMTCSVCHGLPADGPTPFPENVDPPYYARTDVDITDACNTDGTEDNTPEPNGEDTLGLDNDGDLLIDAADPDCAPSGTPGEPGGPTVAPLLVTTHDASAGTLALTVGLPLCGDDLTLIWGALADVGSYGYAGQDCSMDNSGTHNWTFGPTSESLFFLVVANDGTVEGSYGKDGDDIERPDDLGGALCPFSQDISNPCN